MIGFDSAEAEFTRCAGLTAPPATHYQKVMPDGSVRLFPIKPVPFPDELSTLEAAYGASCLRNKELQEQNARLHAENARLKAFVAAVEAALPRENHEGARDAYTFARDSSNNDCKDYG